MRILGYDFIAHHRRCDSKADIEKRCDECKGLDETPSLVEGNDRHCVALAYTKGARYLLIIVDDKRPKAPPKRRFSATTASRIAPLCELGEKRTSGELHSCRANGGRYARG